MSVSKRSVSIALLAMQVACGDRGVGELPPSGTDDGSSEPAGSTGTPSSLCDGSSTDITELGIVGASSVVTHFPMSLSVDGNPSTSWFADPPDDEPSSSLFTWVLVEPRCIDGIALVGNGEHHEPELREGSGFENIVVELTLDSEPVFVAERSLRGTPDPAQAIAVPDVIADRITLTLADHENQAQAGFSELTITGR